MGIRKQARRRFSNEELYNVRNRIPIRHVIESLLAIPSEAMHGVFRFRCPLCSRYHTAIKPETNLARCFDCGRNFNAIDLCMLAKRIDFVESVNFLIGQENRLTAEAPNPSPTCWNYIEPPREKSPKPVALGDILTKLISGRLAEGPKDTYRETVPQGLPSSEDIAQLEHVVHALSQILQQLKRNYNNPA